MYPCVSLCIPVYPCVSLCIPVYPCVSLCIPMYPHAFPRPRHFSLFSEKGKIKGKKGKFLRISQGFHRDFTGISQGFHRDFVHIAQGFRGIIRQEILSLFSKKGKNEREKGKVSGDFWGFRRDFVRGNPFPFQREGKTKREKGKRGGVVDMSYRRLAATEPRADGTVTSAADSAAHGAGMGGCCFKGSYEPLSDAERRADEAITESR